LEISIELFSLFKDDYTDEDLINEGWVVEDDVSLGEDEDQEDPQARKNRIYKMVFIA